MELIYKGSVQSLYRSQATRFCRLVDVNTISCCGTSNYYVYRVRHAIRRRPFHSVCSPLIATSIGLYPSWNGSSFLFSGKRFFSGDGDDENSDGSQKVATSESQKNKSSNSATDHHPVDPEAPSPSSPSKDQIKYPIPEWMGEPLQEPAGPLFDCKPIVVGKQTDKFSPSYVPSSNASSSTSTSYHIPQVPLTPSDGLMRRKRVLILCTGGTLTMAAGGHGGGLAPIQGALLEYIQQMPELNDDDMPDIVAHEYQPLRDSSDLGPADWALLANDIAANYLHFDGFVVLYGTDTMAFCASALAFMLENLGKPVVFTGSQIPLCEPYNDARRNLIMAIIFACRDSINEVTIFFHDRLLRACRSTKVNTHRLMAFDSPNMDPLATIGITIEERRHLVQPQPQGALRVHSRMDTRLLTLRLVPGFDDRMLHAIVEGNCKKERPLQALVLQLYGTGNVPSVKTEFLQLLQDATTKHGILVLCTTQCYTGHVNMSTYATGRALSEVGVVSASDMTLEAVAAKAGYLFGRGDLTRDEIAQLMCVSLRGEVTPIEALSPPPLSSAFHRGMRKGKIYY